MPTYFIRKDGKVIGSILADRIPTGPYRQLYEGAEVIIEEEVCKADFRYALGDRMDCEALSVVIDMLDAFCQQNYRIYAIKYTRKLTQWDLKKSKVFIDQNFAR